MENKKELAHENVSAGIIGAFLFSLAGGILWYVLYQVGFLAGISGVVGVFAAVRGYSFFAKGQSVKGVVISVIVAVLVLIIAWYLCLGTDVYNAYKDWFAAGEVDYQPTFFESVGVAYTFLAEPDIAIAYLKDLGIGLLLCVWASFSSIKNAIKEAKQATDPVAEEVAEPETAQQEEVVQEETVQEEIPQEENETV